MAGALKGAFLGRRALLVDQTKLNRKSTTPTPSLFFYIYFLVLLWEGAVCRSRLPPVCLPAGVSGFAVFWAPCAGVDLSGLAGGSCPMAQLVQ